MLTSLRKHTSGIVAQVLLGLLSLSFVFWGISDVFRWFTTDDTAATVGSEKISVIDFRSNYDQLVRQYSAQTGVQITPDMARRNGIPTQAINRMVDEAALRADARHIGLGLSNEELIRRVRADPQFKGVTGDFDPNKFNGDLYQAGLSEGTYLNLRRTDELHAQLSAAISGGDSIPDLYKQAVNEFFGEERSISYVILPASLAGEIAPPSDEELTKYFNDNKAAWRAPEYRSLVVVTLDTADVAKPSDVTDAEARAAYDRMKNQLTTPEKRQVQQLRFATEDEAKAAQEKLKSGMSFDALVTDLKRAPSDVDLGLIPKSDLADPAIAEAAFALPADGTSDVVKGRFGFMILHVGKIEPGNEVKFEDVADKIKQDLAKDKALPRLTELSDEIEDARSGGASLSDAAKKAGLTPVVIDAVDANGKAPDGSAVNVPGGAKTIAGAFESDVGVENNIEAFGDRGALWYDVTKVDPARERTLEEVHDQVVAKWTQQKRDEKMQALAKAALERVRKGDDMAAIAKDAGATVGETPQLTRNATPQGDLTAEVVSAAFAGKQGYSAVAAGKDGALVVLRVDKVAPAGDSAPAPVATQVAGQLDQAVGADLERSYLDAVKARIGVHINESVIASAVNGTTDGSGAPAGGSNPFGF
jgi:peptidyl-prolyl cis-trans isomerase D